LHRQNGVDQSPFPEDEMIDVLIGSGPMKGIWETLIARTPTPLLSRHLAD